MPLSGEPGGCTDLVEIGRGGFSVVYRGYQSHLQRTVAIKVLTVSAFDEHARRRFERECALTGRLTDHPNIITVFESGFTEGRPFIIMEYFERGSFAGRLAQGPLPVENVLQAGIQLAGALETAHRAGIVHRDIKPPNVLLKRFPRDEPVLADFGISVVTSAESSTSAAFTPVHAPPEMLESNQSSAAGDVYSLASTLWTLLAGRAPFQPDPDEGVMPFMRRVLSDPVPELAGPDVPSDLSGILQRAMAKDANDRLPSAAALGEALRVIQSKQGLPLTDLPLSLDPGPLPGPEPELRLAIRPSSDPTVTSERETIVRPRPDPGPDEASTPPARSPRRTVALVIAGLALLALGGLAVIILLTRQEKKPAAPSDVRVTRVSNTSAVVTWKVQPDNRYPIVIIQSVTGSKERAASYPTPSESQTGHRVEGLDPQQGYCFQVGVVRSAVNVEVGGQGCIDQTE